MFFCTVIASTIINTTSVYSARTIARLALGGIALLWLALPLSATAFELYGPKWLGDWQFQIDEQCSLNIQETILERTATISVFVPLDHTITTSGSGGVYDHNSRFYCSADFNQQLVVIPEGVQYTTFDLQTAVGNTTVGRAHLWWIESEIVEVDIQLDPDLDGWLLRDTLDHEILHGLGCEHSENEAALMYPAIEYDKGHHYDDFLCLHALYGIDHSLIDYLGNVFVPDARILGAEGSFWGVLAGSTVIESGENSEQGR